MNRRSMSVLIYISIFISVLNPALATAVESPIPHEPWYKVIAGIIAIPASVIGLAVSYRLFRKTNLESRKLELEIREKEQQFHAATSSPGLEALKVLAQPFALSHRVSLLLLRFVILDLILRIWHFVPAAIEYIASATYLALATLHVKSFEISDPISARGFAILFGPRLFRFVFDSVDYFIILGFGWPILRDACTMLGIRITSLSDLRRLFRREKGHDAT
jgi:hypothetical protein